MNISFPDWVKVENIIPRNMIINLGCTSVDNHIPRDDIFDYHPIRECNIYIIATKYIFSALILARSHMYERLKASGIAASGLQHGEY